jgi:hypothetical protein
MKIGLPTLLTVLFVGLKLGNVITWPWVWVVAPIWVGFLFYCLLVITIGAIAVAVTITGGR